jgi:excisionase family DNA binding protein
MTSITVDVPGAADLLKVHPKTVLDLIDKGALRAAKIGRSYVMMTKDVEGYIEAQIVRQMAERMGCAAQTRRRAKA